MGYTDIHCHVLPGIDDGAADLEEATGMLKAAEAAGSDEIIATPHMYQPGLGSDDPDFVRDRFERFVSSLEDYARRSSDSPAVALHLGAENYVGTELLGALESDRVLTLAGSRFLLVEFWPQTTASVARHALEAIQAAGLVPVLAHVERYRFLHDEPGRLGSLVDSGCIAQVNAAAVLGDYGLGAARLADRWLRDRLVAVVASDGHGLGARRPELAPVAQHLARRYGPDIAELCLRGNPRAIVQDLMPLPLPEQKRRSWWRRGGAD